MTDGYTPGPLLEDPVGVLIRGDGGAWRFSCGDFLLGLYRQPKGDHLLFTEAQVRAEVAREVAALRAEVERLRVDAERYRWLRAQHWSTSTLSVVAYPKTAIKLGHDCPSMDRLDNAIDYAIRASRAAGEQAA